MLWVQRMIKAPSVKILLSGKNGQVGWELQRSLAPLGELIALDRNGSADLAGDLTNLDGIRRTIQTVKPDIIVNAAAYTAVDQAEKDTDAAFHLNARAPGVMAREAASLGCCFVHYSTDYVFDGSGETPWREEAPTNPVNRCGLTKTEGEMAVQESDCRYLIFRTSWVYGAHGNNFIKTMLSLMTAREELKVVSDQIGAPAGAELIADVTAHALCRAKDRPEIAGIYNLALAGETSWHEFAIFIATQARQCGLSLKLKNIISIPTSEYPTPARRPLNSRLDTRNLRRAFGLHLPNWQQGVSRVIQEISAELL